MGKTYPQLDPQADIQDADVIALYRNPGPLKRSTAALLKAFVLDGFDPASLANLLRTMKPIRTAIPLGTSITQADNNGSVTLPQIGGSSLVANGLYMAGLHVIQNAGVAGDTVYQCSARLPDVLALNPDLVTLECLTNSLTAGMNQSSLVAVLNAYEGMVVACLDNDTLPMIVVPPAKNGAVAEVSWARYFLYKLADYYGLPLADLFVITCDPATGNYRTGMSADGVHPSGDGIVAGSTEIAAAVNDIRSHNGYTYYSAYDNTATGQAQNLNRNGCFSRSTFTPTPDGWTVNTTSATQTLVPVTPSYSQRWATGNTFKFDKAASGLQAALQGGPGSAGWVAGDVLEISGRIKFSGLTNGSGTGGTLQVTFTGVGGTVKPLLNMKFNGDYLLSTQFTVPVGATSVNVGLFPFEIGVTETNALTITNRTANEAVWAPGQLL